MEKTAAYKIKLDIDQDDSFDYEIGKSPKYTLHHYQTLILEQI
jgi:hypothetical protein